MGIWDTSFNGAGRSVHQAPVKPVRMDLRRSFAFLSNAGLDMGARLPQTLTDCRMRSKAGVASGVERISVHQRREQQSHSRMNMRLVHSRRVCPGNGG